MPRAGGLRFDQLARDSLLFLLVEVQGDGAIEVRGEQPLPLRLEGSDPGPGSTNLLLGVAAERLHCCEQPDSQSIRVVLADLDVAVAGLDGVFHAIDRQVRKVAVST